MRRVGLAFSGALMAMTVAVGVPQASAQDQVSGAWVHAGSEVEASDRRAAIEAATEELPSFIRERARTRIGTRTAPVARLSMVVDGDRVEFTAQGRSVVVIVGGPPVRLSGDNGREEVRASRHDGHLRLSMTGEGGSRTTIYRLSEDGQRLVLHVSMTADRLSRPIEYRATYRREGR
jgi:hypothetical protein